MNFSSALFAFWPFASGWMLLWGLAALVPIVIHLWNRRKFQEMSWAAMEFLMAAVRKNSRRIRIEQLILLAVRVAILLLLALALADPVLSLLPTLGGTMSGGQRHWVLVVDGSYSMDYESDGQTRFDRARAWARELIEDSQQGDGFTLVLMADVPQVVIGEPAFDADDVATEINNLVLRHGGADLSGALREVEVILRAAQEKHPRLQDAKICLLSDLGSQTWSAVARSGVREQLARLDEVAELVLLDFRRDAGDLDNLAITRFELSDPVVTTGREVEFEVGLQEMRASSGGLSEVPVELRVDGEVVAKKSARRSGETTNVAFPYRFETAGEHTVEVRIGKDPLQVDNRRYLSVPVRPSIQVLCIEGKPGAAREIALALEPFRTARAAIKTTVLTESALLEKDLQTYDCIFLCNVARLGSQEAAVLHQFVRRGGGLVVTLGDQVQRDSYNENLVDPNNPDESLLPVPLGPVVSGDEYRFDPLEYRHPIVAPFADHERAGLLTVPVLRYFRLRPINDGRVTTALAFEGGDAAILVRTLGRGRSILFASSVSTSSASAGDDADEPWNYLPVWTSFVPLVQEMLSVALEGRMDSRRLLVGEPLVGSVQNLVVNVPVMIENPLGVQERVRLNLEGEVSQWVFERTYWSGLYTAAVEDDSTPSRQYAVNIDPRESQLESFAPDRLPSQIRTDFAAEEPVQNTLARGQQRPFFRYLLLTVMALVFSETFLAAHFGRSR